MSYVAQLMPLLLHCVLLFPQNAPPQHQSQSNDIRSNNEKPSADSGGLDGSWEGELTFLQGANLNQTQPRTGRYRITIQGTSVRVYFILSDDVKEVKSGKFHMEDLMTNAVIFAMDSGKDDEGTWVETWVFSLTEKDKDTLLVNFSRMVNNIDLPLTSEHSKFAKEATGELKRLPPEATVKVRRLSPPIYPKLALQARIATTVVLNVTVRPDGSVDSVALVSGHRMLDGAAMESAQKTDFECKNCRVTSTPYRMTYNFELGDAIYCKGIDANGYGVYDASSDTEVNQSQDIITVRGRPYATCDPVERISFAKFRSAKCLYLWRCGTRPLE